MEELKKYTGRFQAFWDNYFLAKEQIEHRKNTIGLDPTSVMTDAGLKPTGYWGFKGWKWLSLVTTHPPLILRTQKKDRQIVCSIIVWSCNQVLIKIQPESSRLLRQELKMVFP